MAISVHIKVVCDLRSCLSLHCSKLQCLSLRGFTSVTPQQVLTPGDVLRKARVFTEEDVLQYSKPGAVYVSQNLNFKFPVYIGDQIIGEVQATNLRENRNRYLQMAQRDELIDILAFSTFYY
ncbi:hypothetical protein VNO80_06067 [Phaseolus coccineus]|uniref:Uncharacterized protein n=1 Tax=Phaseolus coccineus TaxID=3886 RepID=A0AAN9RE76_PHACN